MKVHSYSPHVAGDVKGIDFCYFLNADVILDPSMITESSLVSGGTDFPVTSSNITDGNLLNYKWYTKTAIPGYADLSKLASDWNSIALYKMSGGDKVYLSLIYWEAPISKTPLFETLTLRYSATSEIKAEGGDIDVDFDYTKHVTEDAKYRGEGTLSQDFYHPQLSGKLRRTMNGFSNAAQNYNTETFNFGLNSIASTTQEVTLSNWGSDSPISDKILPLCVPNITSGELGVSSDLGCYIYQVGSFSTTINIPKGQLNVPLGNSDAFKTSNEIVAPKLPSNSELYIIGREVLVAYCPNTYEVYCSCLKYDSTKGYYYEDFWKVGNGEKIIIPSYFNIFPFALFQDKQGEWKVMNFRAFNTTMPINESEYRLDSTGSDWEEVIYKGCRTIQNFSHSSTDDYVKVCMFEELDRYTEVQKGRIIDYIKNQFYVSYVTFLQCLRYFPDYNIQISDCGCVCRNGEKVLFVPYSPINEKSGRYRRMTSVRRLPDNSKVDNLLFYYDKTIGSILTGETETVSGRVSLKNGVLAQFTS